MLLSFLKKARHTTKRGITLLETLLALSIGAGVIVAGIEGTERYTEGVQIEASANQLERIISLADTWADDNFDQIKTSAPRSYSQNQTNQELARYLGSNQIGRDSFGTQYRMATRKYDYRVPDPANPGGTIIREAFQVLIIGYNSDPGALAANDTLRIDIANSAGAGAGYVSTDIATCSNGAGGRLPPGNICGAFGTYAFEANDFNNTGALNNGIVVGLITKGDSSFYGDQLYRYDYGDPDLNTMRTTLYMDSADTGGNRIESNTRPMTLRSRDRIDLVAKRGNNPNYDNDVGVRMNAETGRVNIKGGPGDRNTTRGDGTINLEPGHSNRISLIGNNGDNPLLTSNTGTIIFGQERDQSLSRLGSSNVDTQTLGTNDLRFDQGFGQQIRAREVSSLFKGQEDPLRLQKLPKGEVIVGNRGRYVVKDYRDNNGGAYELSDGILTAGQLKAQDITCADCGGDLSEILPRWRHMGTYYVAYTSGQGTRVRKPVCTQNRREPQNRNETTVANGDNNSNYSEWLADRRYTPSILLIPRRTKTKTYSGRSETYDVPIDSWLRAYNDSSEPDTFWRVALHNSDDNVFTTAMAMTYCVFTGGDGNANNPTSAQPAPRMGRNTPSATGVWSSKD